MFRSFLFCVCRYAEPDMLREIFQSQGFEYAAAEAQAEEHRMHSSSMDVNLGDDDDRIDEGGVFDHFNDDEEEEMYSGK